MVPDATTRRRALTGGLTGALLLISGCAGLSDGSKPELGRLTVENGDDAPHSIHVVVELDSEPIYGSSHDLDAASPPENGTDTGEIESAVLDGSAWAGETGEWTIHARVDDRTSWHSRAVPTDGDATCRSARLVIEDDASVTIFTPDCGSWPPDGES